MLISKFGTEIRVEKELFNFKKESLRKSLMTLELLFIESKEFNGRNHVKINYGSLRCYLSGVTGVLPT